MRSIVINMKSKRHYEFADLLEIMRVLRSPGGCPWDAEQTHASIRRNMIEEASEAAEAIDLNDSQLLCEELGDVLLQVVFHADMAAGAGTFSIDDVIDGICKKLIVRHPHVFGEVTVSNSSEVLANWDEIKRSSKGHDTLRQSLDAVSYGLPGLMRLQKLLSKCSKAELAVPDADGWVGELMDLARKANEQGVDLETQAAAACRLIADAASDH